MQAVRKYQTKRNAAILIQTQWRIYSKLKFYERASEAAVKVQALWRGHRVRTRFARGEFNLPLSGIAHPGSDLISVLFDATEQGAEEQLLMADVEIVEQAKRLMSNNVAHKANQIDEKSLVQSLNEVMLKEAVEFGVQGPSTDERPNSAMDREVKVLTLSFHELSFLCSFRSLIRLFTHSKEVLDMLTPADTHRMMPRDASRVATPTYLSFIESDVQRFVQLSQRRSILRQVMIDFHPYNLNNQ